MDPKCTIEPKKIDEAIELANKVEKTLELQLKKLTINAVQSDEKKSHSKHKSRRFDRSRSRKRSVTPFNRNRERSKSFSQSPVRVICYNCHKPGHFAKDCKRKVTGHARVYPVLHNENKNPHKTTSATYIQVKINGIKVTAILDSGAAKTLISEKFAKMAKLNPVKKSNGSKWISANKQELMSHGECNIDIAFGNYCTSQECEVIQDLSADALLSTDLLMSQGAVINYSKKTLSIGSTVVPLVIKNNQREICLSLGSKIHIKPNSQQLIWIDIPFKSKSPILIEGINKPMQQWRIPDYLAISHKGKIPLLFSNLNPYPIDIHPKTVIAHVEEVEADIEVPWRSQNLDNVKVDSLIDWDKSQLTRDQKLKLRNLIGKYSDVFSKGDGDLGYCDKFKFNINTGDNKPIKQRAYRVPYAKQDQIDKMVDDMLKQKVISKSKSPWASPVVLVKKKDGTERFCVDFRKLNSVTIKDNYPLPLIDETIDKLRNAKFYSTMDLASGYWQMALDDESKEKTAFITHKGIKPNEDKIKVVKNYPTPENQREVKRFLGFASYYRKFIRDFSSLADPINRLLKKDTKFEWTRLCEESFRKIIEHLTNPPLLAYPDFSKPFHLATDASGVGIAGVLFQYDEQNNEKVIAYASRNLRPSERNYPAIELECLAIVWAVEQFRPYLYRRKFRVVSDHNPLAYLENMKIKSTRIQKWRLMLAEYDKEIVYRKGAENKVADSLSRMEVNCVEDEKVNLAKLQREDEDLQRIFRKLDDTNKYGRYFLKENVLCKKYKKYPDKILVPKKLVESVLSTCHDGLSGGHLGFKKTYAKVKQSYLWKNMLRDTNKWIRSCKMCAQIKSPQPNRANLIPIEGATKPFDMVGVDILGPLPETSRNNKYIVIFTDYLSKWAEALATGRIDAKTIAKILLNLVITRHSAPGKLLSDQGRQFLAALVKEVCEYMKIKKLSTTPYHPECNGQTERFNKTICQILSTYCNDHQSDWDEYLDIALFAYRVSPHETTLKSPFELLFGRNPRLPGELTSGRIKKVNRIRKSKYDKKLPGLEYKVNYRIRLNSPATRQGLTHKLRNDKWKGPYKIIQVMNNNNVEIDIGNGKTKTVHVNRIKHAEESRDEVKLKSILKNKQSRKTVKHVRFEVKDAKESECYVSAAKHDYNLSQENPNQSTKMPKSKSRQWREAKAREIYNRYYGDSTSVPNFNQPREPSPNTMANRKALNNEMQRRGVSSPSNSSNKPKSGTPGLLKQLGKDVF
ncbi:unnamed protein product [Brachionus calyciflorus]|uniref:RNA-directed DNA polymerase n=1 Tax=Brachionus calyciflorus TaxID=104777 RepID=A0A814M118_9BILA|nr:unnamed protein product [Brachionus calyciflorus]